MPSGQSPGRGPGADLFADWPAGRSPAEIGRRVAENFADRPFERPDGVHHLPGGLRLVRRADARRRSRANADLQRRLVHKFDPLLTPEGSKNISPDAHVDYPRLRRGAPRDLHADPGTPRFLELGRSFADKQWETTTPDGITTEARYWIDDMFMITAVQVQAYRATGDRSTSIAPPGRWWRTSTGCNSRTACSSTPPTRRSTGAAATAGWQRVPPSCSGRCRARIPHGRGSSRGTGR